MESAPGSDRCRGAGGARARSQAGGGRREVTYYEVPRGAHPHDVAPAPDGTVWYTAQRTGRARPSSIRRPARRRRFRSGPARRRMASSSGPTAPPGSPTAGRTPSRASIRRPRRSSCSRCRRNFPTPISTPRPSTAKASSGSPARAASTAASIRRPARSRPGRRRRAPAPTASRPRRAARSGTPRSPAIISPRSTP